MKVSGEVRKWRFKNSEDNQVHLAESEASVYSGELLYCWPYRWIPDVEEYQPLVNQIGADVLKYSSRRLTWPEKHDPLTLIIDSIWMATFCCNWADEAQKDSLVYRKLFLYNVFFYVLFVIDDACEKRVRDPRHAEFVQCVGRLLQKIHLLKYESADDIEQDVLLKTLLEIRPNFQVGVVLVFFDVVQDMKSEFAVTTEGMTGLARALRQVFELQTWFGSKDGSHILNLELRNDLRCRTVGYDPLLEFTMVMDGIQPTPNIRDNFYFKRFYRSAETLGYLLNDVLSVLKELQEVRETGKRVDNYILIMMELEHLTFKQALELTMKEHNKKVLEFRSEVEHLLADEGFLIDLDDEEKKTFWQSIDYAGVIISCIMQTHLVMSRYKNKVDYEFVDIQ